MKKFTNLTLTLTILVGSSAMAAVGGDSSPRLTFDQLRTACTNPERFHNQVAPKNLEISC